MQAFLKATEIIDWDHPLVYSRAKQLSAGLTGSEEVARRCFEWVRDEIQHSRDFERDEATCTASEVLKEGTGWCYAKSHLLAAILRANGIPAGLCYQRLSRDDKGPPFSLHGLNAIFLPRFGWYRVDCRGNRTNVDAQFTPPVERLAFPIHSPEERNFPDILADPLPMVISALRAHHTWKEMHDNLPDWTEAALPSASGDV